MHTVEPTPPMHRLRPTFAVCALLAAALAAAACTGSPYADRDLPSLGENPDMLGPNLTDEIIYGQFFVGPEDRIRFDFLRHPEYDGSFAVRGDGRLFLHDIGLIEVSGLTQDELQDLVRAEYARILVNPSVYVEVEQYSPRRKVAVQGYVTKPGVMTLTTPRTTILEVLAMAGGINSEGDRGAILIARRVEGKVQIARYDQDQLFSPADPNQRYEIPYVQDGDYVYVLRSWGATFDEHVERATLVLRGILYLERDIIAAPQVSNALQDELGI
jgi:polysaccharide export outer membrane protein